MQYSYINTPNHSNFPTPLGSESSSRTGISLSVGSSVLITATEWKITGEIFYGFPYPKILFTGLINI